MLQEGRAWMIIGKISRTRPLVSIRRAVVRS
jgi:hypothetical protein